MKKTMLNVLKGFVLVNMLGWTVYGGLENIETIHNAIANGEDPKKIKFEYIWVSNFKKAKKMADEWL